MKNYLDSTSGKKGVTCMVVDNTLSENINDKELIESARILAGDYPDVKSIRLLLKSGNYLTIK